MSDIILQDNAPLKRCPRCPEENQWYPATTEFFRKNRNSKDGLQCYCKKCQIDYQKIRDKVNTEAHQVPLDPSKLSTCTGCHIQKPLTEFHVSRYMKNGHTPRCRICASAQQHRKRERKREHYNAIQRARRTNNHVQQLKYERDYYLKHQEQRLNTTRKWNKQNPKKKGEIGTRRRARRNGAMVNKVSYQRILERDGYWCYICEQSIDPDGAVNVSLTFDHVVPLARQGAHSEENIKPAHRVCNLRKKTRLLEEMDDFARRGIHYANASIN